MMTSHRMNSILIIDTIYQASWDRKGEDTRSAILHIPLLSDSDMS